MRLVEVFIKITPNKKLRVYTEGKAEKGKLLSGHRKNYETYKFLACK